MWSAGIPKSFKISTYSNLVKTPIVIFTSDVANYLSHSLRRGVGLLLGHSTNLDYLESAVVCLEAHCDLHSVGIRWLVSSERTSGKASN